MSVRLPRMAPSPPKARLPKPILRFFTIAGVSVAPLGTRMVANPDFWVSYSLPENFLSACARAGLGKVRKRHSRQHSFPWRSKVYKNRDWLCRGGPWGPLITRRIVQNVKLAWASYVPRGPKSTRFYRFLCKLKETMHLCPRAGTDAHGNDCIY